MRYLVFVVLSLVLVGCLPGVGGEEAASPSTTDGADRDKGEGTLFLTLEAARGEYLAARLADTNIRPSESLRISVDGVEAELVSFNEQVAVFEVPQAVDGLTQSEGQVPIIIFDGANQTEGQLRILGDTEPGTFVALDTGDFGSQLTTALQNLQERENGLFANLQVVQRPSPEQFQRFRSTDIASQRQPPDSPLPFPVAGERTPLINPIADTNFDGQIEENISLLQETNSPCAADLVTFTVAGVPLAELLDELAEVDFPGDGNSVGMGNQTQGGSNQRAQVSPALPFTGRGATIAILDSEIGQPFQGNLLSDLSIDFVNEANTPPHGNLVAQEALLSAPDAQFMSAKVCYANPAGDGVDCNADQVAKGICHALVHAPDGPRNLVINLSFGGPQDLIVHRLLLEHASEALDVSVATSAGNEASLGSPLHYPAAYSTEGNGIMAVAAYEEEIDAPFSGGTVGTFIDITARGESTSFSAPLVAGAMAIFKEASGLSSTEIKNCLKDGARKLPDPPNTLDVVGAGLLDVEGALGACL